jgi:L-cysteine S-thiosulfotransferase
MMTFRMPRPVTATGLALLAGSTMVMAQSSDDALAQYREMMQDDNPAEFWVMRGDQLWKAPRGPNKVSLEQCDLGLGAGVVKGAYAQLPRYFPDARRVMDLETRLVHCMTTLQGMTREEAVRQTYGDGAKQSSIEALTAYVAEQSRGMKLSVPLRNAEERKAYNLGKRIFFFRAGTHDFACATCHGESDRRIRLQDLPNLTRPDGAQAAYSTWPAYRVSQGEVRTMQWRMQDCLRQQRMPQLQFGSEASIAIITFLAHNANGGVMNAPGLKR